jgi:uncharacterized RDD family membrane protein YckC
MSPEQSHHTRTFAGSWPRLGALFLDLLLLGAIGAAAGALFGDDFSQLGAWGRLLGFCVAAVYFGTLNSRITGGQTPGKRLLRIKVVDKDGAPLSVPQSVVRFLPLGATWLLNNAPLGDTGLAAPWIYLIHVSVIGVGLSVAYLFFFNRSTRQVLHDIAAGSYVVPAVSAGTVEAAELPRVHLWVCATLLLTSGAALFLATDPGATDPYPSLTRIRQRVTAETWVADANVFKGTSTTSTDQGTNTINYLQITARLRSPDSADAARAKQLATVAMSEDSSLHELDLIRVSLAYGYDIGIAGGWSSHDFAYSPARWLEQ